MGPIDGPADLPPPPMDPPPPSGPPPAAGPPPGGPPAAGPPTAGPPPSKKGARPGRIAAVVALFALAVGAGIFLTRSKAEATEVLLEATTSVGPEPYFDPDTTPPPPQDPRRPAPSPTPQTADQILKALTSATQQVVGLFGGTGNNRQCDAEKLIGFLSANKDKAAAWARAQGIPVDQIASFVRTKLVALTLRRDTRVTNNGFSNGKATPRQSVLQAGSAVLVDRSGLPRVRCKCGNPLQAARSPSKKVKYVGAKWDGFSEAGIVTITAPVIIEPTVVESPTPTPTRPAPKIVNLSTDAASVAASTTYSSEFVAGLGVDGKITTSWFSSGPEGGGRPTTFVIALKRVSVVTRIEFVGNEKHADQNVRTGFGFRRWEIDFLNINNKKIGGISSRGSGTATQTHPLGLSGVKAIVFKGYSHESPDCGGFAELRAIGYATG